MKVGLFVPCYVDALYPEAGVATYKLLKHYGLDVGYPENRLAAASQWLMPVSVQVGEGHRDI